MNYAKMFRVEHGGKVDLRKIDPGFHDRNENKASSLKKLEKLSRRLRDLQFHLYAEDRRSVLICLQALDAAGKDGTIRHAFGAFNPQGTRVWGFKAPTPEELSHDFLWRIEKRAPAKGEIAIFNRSHYEDVLVARVHDLVPKEVWSKRYDLINDFEERLAQNGTHIIKFFLHISPEEQLARFHDRLDDPSRHWKISESDYSERKLWPRYTAAYEEALSKTSKKHAPWYVVPANHKWFRNIAVAEIVADTLEAMNMKLPAPHVDIEDIRRKYHQAALARKKK